ncbi:MAG: 6-bladed beta-propeller [Dehalococcoidales bacterium]|nr:6-bladed beta-propeller [Dehalococcoidales bacterium]
MRIAIKRIVAGLLVSLVTVITAGVSLSVLAVPSSPPPFLLKWGTVGAAEGEFNNPHSMAVDAAGSIYVADSGNNRIQKFTSSGAFIAQWGILGFGDGEFMDPRGVAVDATGNVYVTDSGNNRIQKFTSEGVFITKWGTFGMGDGQLLQPMGLAVDAVGDVYVADFANSQIQKFSGAGTFITRWGTRGNGDGQFAYPMAVAVDAAGDVYVADTSNGRIQKFTGSGVFITKWGAYGSDNGSFSQPQGLAVDTSGNVYVADGGNNRIQKFSSSGVFITTWGTFGQGDGEFFEPRGITVDASGNIYVADTGNNRIQVFGSPTPGMDIVELTVYETIIVTDSNAVLPPVVLTVNENINVVDAPVVLPPVVLTVNENISVVDAPQLLPSVSLTINENVSVIDSPQTFSFNPPLMFFVFSPVDIQITDPDGLIISKTVNQIPGATYTEADVNGDGETDDLVSITEKKFGNYLITVTPKPGALPADTYTLEVSFGGETIVLAEHTPVSDIPAGGYHITWEESGIRANNVMSFNIEKLSIDYSRHDEGDSINMNAKFALPDGASFDPARDAVKFNIDGVTIDIPAGSFKGNKKEAKYSYDSSKGVEPKVSVKLDFKKGEVTLSVKEANLDIINSSDGVVVTFSIGSVVGKQTFDLYIDTHPYPDGEAKETEERRDHNEESSS